MAQRYGPPSDGSIIPHILEDAIAADLTDKASPIGSAVNNANPPVIRGSRTIILGDSIDANTQGWFTFWAIDSGRVPVLRNAAVSGEATADMLARIQPDVLDHSPDIVILGGSTNDQGYGVEESVTRANIMEMVDRVISSGAVPVLRTTPPADIAGSVAPWNTVNLRRKAVQRHNTWLKLYAQRRGLHVLDLYAAAADPATGGYRAGYTSDGLHPDQDGARAIASTLLAAGVPSVFNGGFALARAVNEDGNLVVNGVFQDADANGLAENWLHMIGTVGGSTSITPGEPGIVGNWQRITSDGTENVAIIHDIVRSGATYNIGDTVEFVARIRSSGGASARVQVMAYGGSGNADAIFNITEPFEFGIVNKQMVPAGENLRIRLIVQLNLGAAGWLELAEVAVRNLTKLGFA